MGTAKPQQGNRTLHSSRWKFYKREELQGKLKSNRADFHILSVLITCLFPVHLTHQKQVHNPKSQPNDENQRNDSKGAQSLFSSIRRQLAEGPGGSTHRCYVPGTILRHRWESEARRYRGIVSDSMQRTSDLSEQPKGKENPQLGGSCPVGRANQVRLSGRLA